MKREKIYSSACSASSHRKCRFNAESAEVTEWHKDLTQSHGGHRVHGEEIKNLLFNYSVILTVISLFTWKESVNDVVRASRPPIKQLLTGMSSGRDARTTLNTICTLVAGVLCGEKSKGFKTVV